MTISFKETVVARIKRDPDYAKAMLTEGVDALFSGELAVGKDLLRDYVNGTIGFDKLSRKVKIPVKSLMRMLGPSGNPQMSNLFAIIGALQAHAGIELHLAAE
ncbi:MAG TPA: transcriptional regulator [Rhizomicrobium sp.]